MASTKISPNKQKFRSASYLTCTRLRFLPTTFIREVVKHFIRYLVSALRISLKNIKQKVEDNIVRYEVIENIVSDVPASNDKTFGLRSMFNVSYKIMNITTAISDSPTRRDHEIAFL